MSPMPSTLIAFLGACALVAASPGPSTVLIIKQSLLNLANPKAAVFAMSFLLQFVPARAWSRSPAAYCFRSASVWRWRTDTMTDGPSETPDGPSVTPREPAEGAADRLARPLLSGQDAPRSPRCPFVRPGRPG